MQQIYDGIFATINYPYPDGYERLHQTIKDVTHIQVNSSVLKSQLLMNDRIGICHQLANEDKIKWVPKS